MVMVARRPNAVNSQWIVEGSHHIKITLHANFMSVSLSSCVYVCPIDDWWVCLNTTFHNQSNLSLQCFMEPIKKVQVEGHLMFAEPQDLFGNLDELCYVSKPTHAWLSCVTVTSEQQ